MIGVPRVHWRLTDSTNERAGRLAAAGAPHGTLVSAGEQAAGRGRQGRAWSAPAGTAVLMSLVLREPGEGLPLAAAVAVCEALPVAAAIKWPNDVLVESRKLAGLLVEGRPQEGWAVLGLGLNVTTDAFPGELEGRATSLRREGVETDTETVLEAVLEQLDAWLPRPLEEVLEAWRGRDVLRGRRVRWNGGEGTAAGVDPSGSLLVDSAGGRQSLHAGEVHLLPGP
jgi:BirA family transcriptional regulator, biotin operon repressor / biotin---[acetyl-CoA-carboxylase] ligase